MTNRCAGESSTIRAQLFESFIEYVNQAGVPYCVLSGYEKEAAAGSPDVDVMVRAQDQMRIPAILMCAARSTGASLVQSIRHETTATYFILLRLQGDQVGYLDVDCYSDYRKNSRTWLLAEEVVANRHKYRTFYVPSVADEFAYYLLKKVLKQAVAPHHLKRLQHLLARDPIQCHEKLVRYWPAEALELQRAITAQDLPWIRRHLPSLDRALQGSRPVETLAQRCKGGLREFARWFQRALQPTGMLVTIAGGNSRQRTQLADQIAELLGPAFRHTRTLPTTPIGKRLAARIEAFVARRCSTLVVSDAGDLTKLAIWQRLPRRCCVSPDLELVLEAEDSTPLLTPRLTDFQVHLCTASSPEGLIEAACGLILQRLAKRIQRRLHLSDAAVAPDYTGSSIEDAQLSPAGSD